MAQARAAVHRSGEAGSAERGVPIPCSGLVTLIGDRVIFGVHGGLELRCAPALQRRPVLKRLRAAAAAFASDKEVDGERVAAIRHAVGAARRRAGA